MRISEVTPVVVGARMRNWIFGKIVTDEGLTGWGEATTELRTRSEAGEIEDFAELIVGENPFRVEHLWQSMIANSLEGRHRQYERPVRDRPGPSRHQGSGARRTTL